MRAFTGSMLVLALSATTALADTKVTVTHGNLVHTVDSVMQAQAKIAAIPGGASVVDSKKFEYKYVLDFKDMLGMTPGVYAQPRFGEEVRLSIRGSGLSRNFHLRGVTVMQDGIPFNLADGSGDFQELDPLLLQHVEVYRGANALQYGANSLGGAINAVTPSADLVPYKYYLRMEGGSYGTIRVHAATAQKMGDADAYIAGTKSVVDGYRGQSEQDKERLYTNIGTKLSDTVETRFYLLYNNLNQELPSTLTRDDALHKPESVAPINIANDYARDIRSVRIANKTSVKLAPNLNLDVGAFANMKTLYHPIFQVIDQDSTDLGAYGRLDGKVETKAGRHEFVLGLNGSSGHTDALRFVNSGGHRGAMTADADQDATNLALYGQDSWFFHPDIALIAGAQAYRSARELEDKLNPATSDDKTYTGLTPKFGLLWNVLPTASVYGNISKSSEVPTFSELVQAPVVGFVPLHAQEAWTYEVGSRGDFGAWSWDVSAYHARVNDELLAFTVNSSTPASIFNADKTVHQGIEAGVGYQFMSGLTGNLVYNFNNFHFDGDAQYGDNTLPGTPRHSVRAQIDYQPLSGWTVSPNVEWTPDGGYVDFANSLDAPGYTVLGLKSDYKVTPNVTVFMDARNLADTKYISNYNTITNASTAATNVFYPGDGRSIYAGVSVKF